MTKKNLVLLAYGRETEYTRAIFCVLSFLSWVKDNSCVRILIYTDNIKAFKSHLDNIDITYFDLDAKLLADLVGESKYIHRIKVGVIDMTLRNFPENDLLFVDSDTFFTANPEILLNGFEQGKSFMHKLEYNFEDGLKLFTSFNQPEYPSSFLRFISNRIFYIDGEPEVFTNKDFSWNSGVLGLNKEFAKLMPDVYNLTDQFYSNSKWFISEQLAFSLILQRKTEIRASDKVVLHYWGRRQKILMDKLIFEFLAKFKNNIHENEMKSTIKKFKLKFDVDIYIEQMEISVAKNRKIDVLKKIIKLILKKPAKIYVYQQILKTLITKKL